MSVIRIAANSKELAAVYRFRYDLSVHELHRNTPHLDHVTGELHHPLDETGVNFVAFDGARVVGVLRQNYGPAVNFGPLSSFYGIAAHASPDDTAVTITTGLLVAACARGGTLGNRLACAAYEHALHRGVRHAYMDCIPPLEPLFKHLGYVAHLPEAPHPEYGFLVRRLRLDLKNREHLERLGSPFLQYLKVYQDPRPVAYVPVSVEALTES